MRVWGVATACLALCAVLVTGPRPAAADILVNISKSSQRMSVLVDGTARYNWKVSTGAKRYPTPTGVFAPQWMVRKWRSRKYNNAPMPNSIFFHQGYAIHGTTEIARLGRIGSHGCVRLHPENAKKLYSLVEARMTKTRIVVSNDPIGEPGEAPIRKPSQVVAEGPAEKPAVEPGIALDALALAAADAPPQKARTEKVAAREPVKSRRNYSARPDRPGFHW